MRTMKLNWALLLLITGTQSSAFQPHLACRRHSYCYDDHPHYRDSWRSVRRHTRTAQADSRSIAGIKFEQIPKEIQSLVDDLEAVQNLPRIKAPEEDFNGLSAVCPKTKPTFRRLFTHETWKIHIGGSTLQRWIRAMSTTPNSVILRAVSKTVIFLSLWAGIVSYSLPKLVSCDLILKDQTLPLSVCGNAIGLLLVFRTNEAYRRLEEARDLMEQIIHLSGEVVSTLVTAWRPYEDDDEALNGSKNGVEDKPKSVRSSTVASVCRHLAAFVWLLRDEFRDGDTREDVMRLLLPPKEAAFVSSQRSRALAVHGQLRRIMYKECREGRLPDNLHFLNEGNLKALSSVAAACERLFTSPIPPTMSRHGLRSMTLWMMALPVVLSFSIPPILNVAWTCAISFIYLGIDELGVQVEQPFRVLPMWQIAQLAQKDILEHALHVLALPV